MLVDLLPAELGLMLDVGAGRGRNAAWFAELPALSQVYRQGHAFHVILLSGVWQHVLPAERERAMRKLFGLLRAGGMLARSLRHGPDGAARGMHSVSLDEVEGLARALGAMVKRAGALSDQQGRPGVSWTGIVLRLPDELAAALSAAGRRQAAADAAEHRSRRAGLCRTWFRLARGSRATARLRIGARFAGLQAEMVQAALHAGSGRTDRKDAGHLSAMAAAMTWAEPARDVALPRARAILLLERGEPQCCVWSGRKLKPGWL